MYWPFFDVGERCDFGKIANQGSRIAVERAAATKWGGRLSRNVASLSVRLNDFHYAYSRALAGFACYLSIFSPPFSLTKNRRL
jgi:hypothetical protein